MDALDRRRRSLLAVLAASLVGLALVGCAAKATSGPTIGVSDRHPANTGVRDSDGGVVDGTGLLPPAYRTTFTKLNKARFVSQGHAAGRWEVDVYANETAAKALSSRARAVPPGAIVVEEHFERPTRADDARPPGPVMMMEKRPAGFSPPHGDWRWLVVGSKGQLVQDGPVESCAGCHDDAPMDGLFPIVE